VTEQQALPRTSGQKSFLRFVRRRLRVASFAVWLRAGGIQFAWLVILVAGAAIPLSEALIDQGWSWISPTLGFLIVVAAGVERIFGRTTEAAVALDKLRRELAREHRMLVALAGPYSLADDRFALYAQRTEEHIARYDEQMVAYHSQVVRDAS
jgi:hypothetical protein